MIKKMLENSNRLIAWIIGCYGVLLGVLFLGVFPLRSLNADETEAIHCAWKIFQGEIPYIDFFEHHHLLMSYILAPFLHIFRHDGSIVIWFRLLIILCVTVPIFFVTYKITELVFNRRAALISPLLLCTSTMFYPMMIEVKADIPMLLFCLISFYYILLFFENRKAKYITLSALSAGLAFLFLQKSIFFIFLIGCLILFDSFKKKNWFVVIRYVLIFFITTGLYAIYLAWTGSLNDYFVCNWLLNIKILDTFRPWVRFRETFNENTLLWTFYIIGVTFFISKEKQKRFVFVSLGLIVSMLLYRCPYRWYFAQIFPLVVAVASYAMTKIFKNTSMLLLIVFLATIGPAEAQAKYCLDYFRKKTTTLSSSIERIDYILQMTDDNDYVMDYGPYENLFRKDSGYFWFSLICCLPSYQQFKDYDYDFYSAVKRYKPKLITLNGKIEHYMDDSRIIRHYERSDTIYNMYLRKD